MKSFSCFKKYTYSLLLLPIIFSIGSFQNTQLEKTQLDNYSKTSFTENSSPFVEQISAGGYYSAAVVGDHNNSKNDSLYTWGDNSSGQLGLGNDDDNKNVPQKVDFTEKGDIEIEQISMGYQHSAAVVNDGTGDVLYTWGNNKDGQLGIGTDTSKNNPQEVTALPDGDIEQISMGNKHSAAVVNDGTGDVLYTWGDNEYGQLGFSASSSSQKYSKPKEVTSLPDGDIEQISLGSDYTTAVVDNTLYTWGINDRGQLGLGDYNSYDAPQQVNNLPSGDIEQIATGYKHTAAIINDDNGDHLYTWGWNINGQLGINDNNDRFLPTNEVDFPGLIDDKPKEINQVGLGLDYTTAIIDQGNGSHLYAWGNNSSGQLGIPNVEETNYPQELLNLTGGDVKQVSAGKSHTIALTDRSDDESDQTLSSWGGNANGELGLGDDFADKNEILLPEILARTPTAPIFTNSQITELGSSTATLEFTYFYGNDPWNKQYETLDKLVVSDKSLGYKQTFSGEDIEILGSWGYSEKTAQVNLTGLTPGEEYNLELEGTFSSSSSNSEKIVVSSGPTFTTFNNDQETTLPKFEAPPGPYPIDNITADSATVYFSYVCGSDSSGEPYKLDKLTVTNTNDNHAWNQSFNSDELTITVDNDYRVNGSVDISDLNPNTEYNLKLAGDFKTINDSSSSDSFTVEPFTTTSETPTAESPEFIEAEATSITDETTTIQFKYRSGYDEQNISYKLTNLTVSGKDERDVPFKQEFAQNEIIILNETDGVITASVKITDLEPETKYDLNLTGIFITENSKATAEIIVPQFETSTKRTEPELPLFTEAVVENYSDNSAIIKFTYSVGDDGFGVPYKLTKLIITDGEEESEFEPVSFTEKNFYDVTSTGNSTSAKITVQNLKPSTPYKLNLNGTFTSENEFNESNLIVVDEFTTKGDDADNEEPPEFVSSSIVTYDDTNATIQFTYKWGHDDFDNPYEILKQLSISDSKNNLEKNYDESEIKIINTDSEKKETTALVELENLIPNTSYNLILNGTFFTSPENGNIQYNGNVTSNVNFTTLSNKGNDSDNLFFNYWYYFLSAFLILIIIFISVIFLILQNRKKDKFKVY